MVITKEQLQERANYMGGSDAAAIMGLSKWKTPLMVYMAKVYPNPDNSENCIGGKNEAAYWGEELEDIVAKNFSKVTGKKVQRVNKTLVHPDYPFICANLDRTIVKEEALLEIKPASAYKGDEWEDDDIPMEYVIQVMEYLAITGDQGGYIACLLGGQKFVWKYIPRDEELIKQIIDAMVSFWNTYIIPKTPPVATGSERDEDMLKRLYPDAEKGSEIELPDTYEVMIDQMKELEADVKIKDERITEVKNQIKQLMAENEAAKAGKYLVTWKNQVQTGFDKKGLKEKHPAIYESFETKGTIRVLRTAIRKEKV
jgi:putative phage-type endonuclease